MGGLFPGEYSKPPIRAEKTHEANQRAGRHLKEAFGDRSIREITADDVELYLRRRLQARVQIKTGAGVVQKDRLKPTTVHQELRVLRRMLNVAVRKTLLPANPCAGVEFPVGAFFLDFGRLDSFRKFRKWFRIERGSHEGA